MEQQKNRTLFWIVNGLIAAVVLIFVIQNWGKITFNFLGIKLEGFGFLVFLIIFLLGFFSGWLWTFTRRRRKNKDIHKKDQDVHYLED